MNIFTYNLQSGVGSVSRDLWTKGWDPPPPRYPNVFFPNKSEEGEKTHSSKAGSQYDFIELRHLNVHKQTSLQHT